MAKTPTKTTAIGFTSHLPIADPKSLFAQQIEVPELRPHDLLVEVEAVSVNPVDVKLRAGTRPGGPEKASGCWASTARVSCGPSGSR